MRLLPLSIRQLCSGVAAWAAGRLGKPPVLQPATRPARLPALPARRRRFFRGCGGQALVELAVFGSLMLMVMGALISYALGMDYRQDIQMRTFRQAMNSAAVSRANAFPSSVTHVNIEDRMVPDPSDPLGLGTRSNIAYGATSPTRTFKMGQTADLNHEDELPRQVMSINGEAVDCPSADRANAALVSKGKLQPGDVRIRGCTTAGFRRVNSVRGFIRKDGKVINNPDAYGPIDRYNEIYGTASVRVLQNTFGAGRASISIIDPMAGEMVSYDTAARLCRLLMNWRACRTECRRGKPPGSDLNCGQVCSQRIATPWYCDPSPNGAGLYTSAALDALFDGFNDMGVQQDTVSETGRNRSLVKQERRDAMITTDHVRLWRDATSRLVFFRDAPTGNPLLPPDGNVPGDLGAFEQTGARDVANQSDGSIGEEVTRWETVWSQ